MSINGLVIFVSLKIKFLKTKIFSNHIPLMISSSHENENRLKHSRFNGKKKIKRGLQKSQSIKSF